MCIGQRNCIASYYHITGATSTDDGAKFNHGEDAQPSCSTSAKLSGKNARQEFRDSIDLESGGRQ